MCAAWSHDTPVKINPILYVTYQDSKLCNFMGVHGKSNCRSKQITLYIVKFLICIFISPVPFFFVIREALMALLPPTHQTTTEQDEEPSSYLNMYDWLVSAQCFLHKKQAHTSMDSSSKLCSQVFAQFIFVQQVIINNLNACFYIIWSVRLGFKLLRMMESCYIITLELICVHDTLSLRGAHVSYTKCCSTNPPPPSLPCVFYVCLCVQEHICYWNTVNMNGLQLIKKSFHWW